MKSITDLITLLLQKPLSCSILLVFMGIVLYNTYLSFDNRKTLSKIKFTLYGNSYEQDVNGHGLYQKVQQLDDKLDGDDN